MPGVVLNFLTLACRDVERMADFLRALGWPEAPTSEPVHRVFQLPNGLVVALYGAHNYERDYGPRSDGFRGFTLGINLGSRDEVVGMHERLQTVDGVASLDNDVVDSPSQASRSATRRATCGTSPGNRGRASAPPAT